MALNPILQWGSGQLSPGGSNYTPAQTYGTTPQLPSPTQSATTAIQGNIGNLGSLYGLSTGTGAASGAGALANAQQGLPNLTSYLSAGGADVASELSGQLPAGVMAQLAQGAAQNNWGSGGSTSAAYEQALGLNSLQMEQAGLQGLGQLTQANPTGPAYNPAAMQVSPEAQQQAGAAQSLYNAAPVPAAAAAANMGGVLAGLGMGRAAGQAPSGSAYGTPGAPPSLPSYGGGDYGTPGTPPASPLVMGNTLGGLGIGEGLGLPGIGAEGGTYMGANPTIQDPAMAGMMTTVGSPTGLEDAYSDEEDYYGGM